MNRRDLLKALPLLPFVTATAAADQVEVKGEKLIAFVPAYYSPDHMRAVHKALAGFESGEGRALVVSEDIEIFRVPD